MPKMRKDLAEATKAVNTHDDISFVVSFGAAFHNPNGSIAAKIEDVHSYAYTGQPEVIIPADLRDNGTLASLIGKRVSAGVGKKDQAGKVLKSIMKAYEGFGYSEAEARAEGLIVKSQPGPDGQSDVFKAPEGYKWAARIKAYTKTKEDKVYNNYALDGFWLTPE